MPLFVLFAEFVMPYSGEGASMWLIALFVAGLGGLFMSSIGVAIGAFIMRKSG
jgi:hypothetical protein